ncbi:MAG: STAS domain-containing protein [Nitrospirota bacterium]|nr:STAS domain-containing protein [Nitrospirota bacterium]
MNLDGEIDARKVAEINRVVGQLIKGEMYGLILNFEAVEHINFATLPSLVEEKKRLQAFGGDLRLACLSDYVKNIFKTTNILEEFQVFDSAQQAAKSFGVTKPVMSLPLGL